MPTNQSTTKISSELHYTTSGQKSLTRGRIAGGGADYSQGKVKVTSAS